MSASFPAPQDKDVSLRKFREAAVKTLPTVVGVYALCDLDGIPIYVGKSDDGIRQRVQRHLTSARSDVIANRQLDVWEVAYILAWPMPGAGKSDLKVVESYLIGKFNSEKPLLNGTIPVPPAVEPDMPERLIVQILPTAEIDRRKNPIERLPRQIDQLRALVAYILEVKDNKELRRTLAAHFGRLEESYKRFLTPVAKPPKSTSPKRGQKNNQAPPL